MLCAVQSDWLLIEEWALLLSPASQSAETEGSTSNFEEILVVGLTDHPTSSDIRHFTCTAATAARLELRKSNGGQYGLTEVTLFGYSEAEDGLAQFEDGLCHCRNGGSCSQSAESCRCPRGPSCPPFSRGCGWTGQHCTNDIDECADSNYGGCGAHSASVITGDADRATCTNMPGSYSCDCRAPRWRGRGSASGGNVCADVDECRMRETNPCEGECHNDVGGFHCSCRDGFVLSSGYKCDLISEHDVNEAANSAKLPWVTRRFGVDAYVFFITISVLGSILILVTVAIVIARQRVKEDVLAEQSQFSETALLLAEIPSDDVYFEDKDEDHEDYFYGADRSGRRGRRAPRRIVKVRLPTVTAAAAAAAAAAGGAAAVPVGEYMEAGGHGRQQPAPAVAWQRITPPPLPPPPPPRTAEIEEHLRKDPRRRTAGKHEATSNR